MALTKEKEDMVPSKKKSLFIMEWGKVFSGSHPKTQQTSLYVSLVQTDPHGHPSLQGKLRKKDLALPCPVRRSGPCCDNGGRDAFPCFGRSVSAAESQFHGAFLLFPVFAFVVC